MTFCWLGMRHEFVPIKLLKVMHSSFYGNVRVIKSRN